MRLPIIPGKRGTLPELKDIWQEHLGCGASAVIRNDRVDIELWERHSA